MSFLRVPPRSRALRGWWFPAPHSSLPELRGPEHVPCLSHVSPWPGPTSGLHQSAFVDVPSTTAHPEHVALWPVSFQATFVTRG